MNQEDIMTCTEFELESLQSFAKSWLATRDL